MDLIAPEVPDAQKNRSPDIFLQGLGQGLAAVARFSEQKRQSEMEMLRLAEHERLAQEQTQLEREKMSLDHDIRQQTLDVSRTVNTAHAEYYRAHAKAYADGTATATQRAIAYNQQRSELVNEVNNQATELRLDDPNFATKEPVRFAANVMQFEDMFSLSPLPEVKHAIKQYRTLADQQKIPLKVGATFDDTKQAWVGGTQQMVPVWQVVRNMKDPEQQEATIAALEASGHTKIIETVTEIAGGSVPVTRTELAPSIKRHVEEGKNVEFKRVPSKVPSAMLPKGAAAGTSPTELPEEDLPVREEPQASATPRFDETETDKLIGQAKAAIARGASREAVAARLAEFGIDPGDALAA